jgi:xyloglucan-specific exo-beta-1,4-glucanase
MAGTSAGGGGGTDSDMGGAGAAISGGTTGNLAGEGGAAGMPSELPELVVLYADYSEDVESTQIRAAFMIENRSDVDVSLRSVTLRYYYTLEDASEQDFVCDYADDPGVVNDCDGIHVTFGTLTLPSAKDYVEVSFEPPPEDWILSALGGKSGLMRLRFFKTSFSLQNQENDYSYRAGESMDPTEEQDHVTLYIDGQLAYGKEPQ